MNSLEQFHYADLPNAMNDVPVVTTLSSGARVQSYSNKVVDQRRAQVQVQPSSATATTITSLAGSIVDFRLENAIDRISSVWLRVKYSNTSGAACIVAVADAWLAVQQIYGANGSNLLYQSVNNVESYITNAFLSREEYEGMASKRLSNSVYFAATTSLADGTNGYIYIPIALPFFQALKLRPYTIDGNLLIRLQFATSAPLIASGTMDLQETVLLFNGFYESDAQRNKMLAEATMPKILPFYAFQRHNETLTLSPSTRYQIRLSGLTGACTVFCYAIRAVANISSTGNQFSFVDVESFDILDPSNRSITGFKPQTIPDNEILYAHQFPNLFQTYTYAGIWSFSQTPVLDISAGTNNGFVEMNGFHSFQFNTKSTLVGGSYQVLCFALCQEELRIISANLSASRA